MVIKVNYTIGIYDFNHFVRLQIITHFIFRNIIVLF